MKLKQVLYPGFYLVPIILFTTLQLSGKEWFGLRSVYSLAFLFVYPGQLLTRWLRLRFTNSTQTFVSQIGLSILFLMMAGLAANQLRVTHLSAPLNLVPITVVLSASLGILWLLVVHSDGFRRRRWQREWNGPISLTLLGPVLVTLLAVGGAQILNNDGSSVLSLITLVLLLIQIGALYWKMPQLTTGQIAWVIYWTGLTLLLMTSLRGWFISGHDILREFYVFQLTKTQGFWDMHAYQDAYNACLSITILPTMLSHLTAVPDIYIFKIVDQFVFAFCPVVVWLLARRFLSGRFSLLATLVFISFPTFFNDMPFLIRQEFGFLFFSLFLLTLFEPRWRIKKKRLLSGLFLAGIVLSHYSTAYVTLVLLIGSVVTAFFLKKMKATRRWRIKSLRHQKLQRQQITIQTVTILLLLILSWNVFVTKTAQNIWGVGKLMVHDLLSQSSNGYSGDIGYGLFNRAKKPAQEVLADYVTATSATNQRRSYPNDFFTNNLVNRYPMQLTSLPLLPLTKLGMSMNGSATRWLEWHEATRRLIARLLQIWLVFGIGITLYKGTKIYNSGLLGLAIAGLLLIALVILLPQLSVSYGLLRIFQQLLIFGGIFLVVGLGQFIPGKRHIKEWAALVIVIFILGHVSGLFPHLTGGFYGQLNLDNSGLYYLAYYIHNTDVAAINWMKQKVTQPADFQADTYAADMLLAYGKMMSLRSLNPAAILKSSYVFLDYANVIENTGINLDTDNLLYQTPRDFLEDTKNLIYSNGAAEVYH